MQRREVIRALCSSALAAGTAGLGARAWAAGEDNYPTRPIRLIVPYAAGGVVDVQTRALAGTLQNILKQPIVVEAKPGASGSIAAESVMRAAPDGYTLLVSTLFLVNNPLIDGNLRWKTQDFMPVGRFSHSTNYFTVPMNSPAKTVREFVALAKNTSPPLQYGDGGVGTTQSIAIEVFRTAAGVQLDPVLYKGAPFIIADLTNGLLAMSLLPSSVVVPLVKSKLLRALANTGEKRSQDLPDVPTIAEAGFPEVTTLSWCGLHAPAGTPAGVIQTLEAAMRQACAAEEFKQRLIATSGEEAFMGTRDFAAFIDKEARRSEKVMKGMQFH